MRTVLELDEYDIQRILSERLGVKPSRVGVYADKNTGKVHGRVVQTENQHICLNGEIWVGDTPPEGMCEGNAYTHSCQNSHRCSYRNITGTANNIGPRPEWIKNTLGDAATTSTSKTDVPYTLTVEG